MFSRSSAIKTRMTSLPSTPFARANDAISFANAIFTAWNALSVYLIISDGRIGTTKIGAATPW